MQRAHSLWKVTCIVQAPVVQKLDSAIHRINYYPVDKYQGNQLHYPLSSTRQSGWLPGKSFTGASYKTSLFQYISYFKTRLKQYPKVNRPEYNERSANLQPCQQPCYSFSGMPSILRVVSMEMSEKYSLFGYIVFFLNE